MASHSTGVDTYGVHPTAGTTENAAYAHTETAIGARILNERIDAEKEAYQKAAEDPPSYPSSIIRIDSTHRKLKPRHIQLIGIGGTIGTALYVQIGRGLLNGGPASLFMAFTIW